jgi:hypothetical protein
VSEPTTETRWSVYVAYTQPVVIADCPRCHLRMEFFGKRAHAPVFRHCRRDELPPAPIADRIAKLIG